MSKIYFSGSFDARETIQAHAQEFVDQSYGTVTSNWLLEPEVRVIDDGREDWVLRARANEDRIDVERSDAVVVFTDTRYRSRPPDSGVRHRSTRECFSLPE